MSARFTGRAPLYGLAIGGAAGAGRVLALLAHELNVTMGMLGARTLDDLQSVARNGVTR